MRGQFLRFLLVGGTATLLHYAVLVLLHKGCEINGVLSTTAGFLLSALFNFWASYRFTFKSRLPLATAAVRYAAVSGTGMAINGALYWLFANYFGVAYLIAQVIATGVVLVWNFLLGRYYTFK